MSYRHQRVFVALVFALLFSAHAIADDLAPAPFRGEPNSVMAKFDLFGAPVPGPPTTFTTGAGATYPLDPLMPFVGQPITDPTNGALTYPIGLPNYIDDLPLKLIRVQYSWFGTAGDAQTTNILPSPGGMVQQVGSTPPVNVMGNIFHRWDDFEIMPNPDSERFEITFTNADPRWVIIDTISIPEPASASLWLIALVSVVCLRRR